MILALKLAAAVALAACVPAFRRLLGIRAEMTPRGRVGWSALAVLWAAGGWVLVSRFTDGLSGMTNLTDANPWGLWVAFDILFGIAMAAGGFVVAGATHVLGIRALRPIARMAVLAAYLGYLVDISALMLDLGRPYNVWHPMIYWQHHSALFEVGWCVMLYTSVLTLEFLPAPLERLGWSRVLRIVRWVTPPVVGFGVLLSTLHQSSLGTLFLIMPGKLLALWHTPMLPVLFFLTAVLVGLAMAILVTTLSARATGRTLETDVIAMLGRALVPLLAFHFLVRIGDLTARGAWPLVWAWPWNGFALLAELALLSAPGWLLWRRRPAAGPDLVFRAAWLVLGGVLLNRLNTGWLGMLPLAREPYVPSWQEVTTTVTLASFGVAVFSLGVRYLPVFERPAVPPPVTAPG